MRLHAVVSDLETARAAIEGGATVVQLRVKAPTEQVVQAGRGFRELPAIFISGGAGLRLAQGLLFPGFLPRQASVARAGGESLALVGGCVPLLVIAGLVEAFVSPTDLAISIKFALAATLFVLLTGYLLLGAWPSRPE